MFSGFEHVGVMADDPLNLARWYEQTLGFRIVLRTDAQRPIVFIAGPDGAMAEFIPCDAADAMPEEKDRRMHLAVGVDDFEAAVIALEAKGVRFPDPPIAVFDGGKARFFQDPEGNWLHLIHRPRPLWPQAAPGTAERVSRSTIG